MKKLTSYFLLTATILFITEISSAQNNLAAGDLAIVSYQSDFDPSNTFTVGIAEFEDRFSIVVLRSGGLAAGTVIFFTERGWNGPASTWLDEGYPPFTFGTGREAVIQWTVPAGGIAQGTEVFFINRYHDEVASPNEYYDWGAYSNHAGTVTLGAVASVTPIVPAANSTDGMNLTFSGDNVLVYQTGPPAGPTGGYNNATIRFITAILADIRPADDPPATNYATWTTAPTRLNESSLPPGLVNGQTCFVMSPGPLPHLVAPVPGTVEPDNGKFSNNALSSAGTCTPLQMSAIIYNIANWTYNNAVFPLGTSSSFCTYTIIAPVTYSLHPSTVTACTGLPVSFTVTASGGGTLSYQWQESADAAFTAPTTLNNTGVYSGALTSALSISDNTGLTGRYYRAIVTGSCGAVNSNGALLTVTNPVLSTNNTITQAVTAQNNIYYAPSCGVISKVVPSGVSPVTGNLTAQVWVEGPAVPTYAGRPFVQRHYQLTPGTSPATATATVTLYFSQAEFTAFNAHAGSISDLPTGIGDAGGKANLRIAKYNGSSNNSSGLPGTYTSGASIIDPPDANIVFNTTFSRWEVTFDVSGFSGFIVQTNLTVLPVKIISFRAQKMNNDIQLSWLSSSGINADRYELERSTDGSNFLLAGQVSGTTGTDYSFTDAGAAGLTVSKLFYRLRIIGQQGDAEYSNVVVVPLNKQALFVTGIGPNPFSDKLTINLNLPSKGKLGVKITDVAGKELYNKKSEMLNGYSAVTIGEVSMFSGGVYLLSVNFNGQTVIYKLVKN